MPSGVVKLVSFSGRMLVSRSSRPSGFGGARRDRTDDLLLAKQALSQLSYGPFAKDGLQTMEETGGMVGLGRFELPTSPLSGVRSNQLSYRPPGSIATGRPLR